MAVLHTLHTQSNFSFSLYYIYQSAQSLILFIGVPHKLHSAIHSIYNLLILGKLHSESSFALVWKKSIIRKTFTSLAKTPQFSKSKNNYSRYENTSITCLWKIGMLENNIHLNLTPNYMESVAELYLRSAEERFGILVSSSATQFLSALLQSYLVISQWNFVGMYSRMTISKCNHWNIF